MRLIIRNSIALFFILALASGCGNQSSTALPERGGQRVPDSTGPTPSSAPASTSPSLTQPSSTPPSSLPSRTPPEFSVHVWELLERLLFENSDFTNDLIAKDKVHVGDLEGKKNLIESALEGRDAYLRHIVTAPSIAAIKKEHLAPNKDDISLIFVNLTPGDWDRPIRGEVKFINDMRFQFIALDKKDSVAVILGSEELSKSLKDSISIKIPWDPASEIKIGAGGKGAVYRVTYEGRTFAIKRNVPSYAHYVNEEIKNYEALKGLDGFGPYLGFLGDKLDVGLFGGGGSSVVMMLDLGEPLKDSLKRLSKPEVEALFKPILEIVGRLHDLGMYHSDIKPANFLLINNKPSLIDLDNVQKGPKEITKYSGQTHPYYKLGDDFGIKADLKALGFSFFEMRYYGGRDGYSDKFKESQGEWYFAGAVNAKVLIDAINANPKADNIDQAIKGLLQGSYNNAAEALADF